VALGLSSSQITNIGTTTFVKNSVSAASGGTDSVVVLKGGIGSTLAAATTTLALVGDAGIAGTLISGGVLPTATSTSSIAISAQFARSGTTAPSSGAFSATIPLLARYN
jgi:NH3-dependent NAD+ synthetase